MCNLEELYEISRALAVCVVPNEYGISDYQKLKIGAKIAKELLGKILLDLNRRGLRMEGLPQCLPICPRVILPAYPCPLLLPSHLLTCPLPPVQGAGGVLPAGEPGGRLLRLHRGRRKAVPGRSSQVSSRWQGG